MVAIVGTFASSSCYDLCSVGRLHEETHCGQFADAGFCSFSHLCMAGRRCTSIGSAYDSLRPYNHYSLLRSIEDWFALDHLGYAATDDLQPLGAEIISKQPVKASR